MHSIFVLVISTLWYISVESHFKNLAWNGGPLHHQRERGVESWMKSGHYIRENVIATKAFGYQEDVYVVTPRMKSGILATLWLIVQGKKGVELQPYPELRSHKVGNCEAIQNAVDVYQDHLSKLWILDSGMVDTLSSPQCTCPPKVVVINLLLGKLIKTIDIAALLEASSLPQNIAVEHTIGGSYVYVTDASRGSILVHEVATGSEWSVVICGPAAGLQITLVKKATHSMLIAVRLHAQGIIELDTAALRRKDSLAPLTVFAEHSKPMVLLGSDGHQVYLRHTECSDVLVWDTRIAYNTSQLNNIHSAGPRLTTTSVTAFPFKPILLVLDSNHLDTLHVNAPTYHKITFVNNFHL